MIAKLIRITEKQEKWLKENVGKRQESEIIRRALDEYINREGKN